MTTRCSPLSITLAILTFLALSCSHNAALSKAVNEDARLDHTTLRGHLSSALHATSTRASINAADPAVDNRPYYDLVLAVPIQGGK